MTSAGELIWVLAGTRDAREIVRLLRREGRTVVASAVTERGRRLMKKAGAVEVVAAMDAEAMVEFIKKRKIGAVVDATHPFAVDASKNAMAACSGLAVPYLRFERGSVNVSGNHVHLVKDFREAGVKAAELGDVVFFAAGSNNLDTFKSACKGARVITRVLPDNGIVERCVRLGIREEDIVAGVPPYTKEENLATFEKYRADVLVTKESGEAGGINEKVEAARELGMEVVVVKRPPVEYPLAVNDYGDVLEWVNGLGS